MLLTLLPTPPDSKSYLHLCMKFCTLQTRITDKLILTYIHAIVHSEPITESSAQTFALNEINEICAHNDI